MLQFWMLWILDFGAVKEPGKCIYKALIFFSQRTLLSMTQRVYSANAKLTCLIMAEQDRAGVHLSDGQTMSGLAWLGLPSSELNLAHFRPNTQTH